MVISTEIPGYKHQASIIMQDKILSPVNRLILGDNLEIFKTLESESVDLIYLTPPFFSNRNYEVIWGDEGDPLKMSCVFLWISISRAFLSSPSRPEECHIISQPKDNIFSYFNE